MARDRPLFRLMSIYVWIYALQKRMNECSQLTYVVLLNPNAATTFLLTTGFSLHYVNANISCRFGILRVNILQIFSFMLFRFLVRCSASYCVVG